MREDEYPDTWVAVANLLGGEQAVVAAVGRHPDVHDASDRPGEFFVFGFSAYRDTLTLTAVKGEISPLNFRAKPWRRLATTPTRRFFSKRCSPPSAALRP